MTEQDQNRDEEGTPPTSPSSMITGTPWGDQLGGFPGPLGPVVSDPGEAGGAAQAGPAAPGYPVGGYPVQEPPPPGHGPEQPWPPPYPQAPPHPQAPPYPEAQPQPGQQPYQEQQPYPEPPAPAGQPGPQTPVPGSQRTYSTADLIEQLNPTVSERARRGMRARFGLKPSERELAEARDEELARTPFSRPVTVMVANPKGGVGKTPTALLLAAAFGTCRGGGVIAWDNNELRGTMPDRSLSPHRRTVRDLLDATEQLAAPQSQFTDLAVFLNHQTPGKFHTLGSAQSFGHVVSHENFLTIHGIMSRYFQIIVVDTGNNEASPNWLAAAEKADCLVVPTKWRKDSLIPAARMLETLREKQPELLDRAVIVATNGPADSQEEVKRNGSSWFGSSHPIVEIPTDPHIAEGGVIDWSKLQPRTRRSALSLAAQVAERTQTVA